MWFSFRPTPDPPPPVFRVRATVADSSIFVFLEGRARRLSASRIFSVISLWGKFGSFRGSGRAQRRNVTDSTKQSLAFVLTAMVKKNVSLFHGLTFRFSPPMWLPAFFCFRVLAYCVPNGIPGINEAFSSGV